MKVTLIPYDSRTAKTRKEIMGDRNSYNVNEYYPAAFSSRVFYSVNQRGYIHLYTPRPIKMNGKIVSWTIDDKILTVDNRLKDKNWLGRFSSEKEAVDILTNKR